MKLTKLKKVIPRELRPVQRDPGIWISCQSRPDKSRDSAKSRPRNPGFQNPWSREALPMIVWQIRRRKDNKLIWPPDLVTRIPHSLIEMPIWQYMAFKMTNAELLFEFLMEIYSSNFALIRKATVLNYPLPSDLIDVIQHKAFYIII